MKKNWFEVDKEGLARLVARQGKSFIVRELVQNAWDQQVSEVHINLEKIGPGKVRLTVVDDDPKGFIDLSHAFTLFAQSPKMGDPTKRGIFVLGEKLVLALCYRAEVSSTKGTIELSKQGRKMLRKMRKCGSSFVGNMKMSQAEYDELCKFIQRLIPPVKTVFNGEPLRSRAPVLEFRATMPTVVGNEQGQVHEIRRETTIKLYEPLPGETASIYEMGIPVVETGDRWHVEVCQ